MHDRPIPHRTHMPKYQKKKCATITTTATIQQNMYKYANTRKKKNGNVSTVGCRLGECRNGNGCGRRTAMHGKL